MKTIQSKNFRKSAISTRNTLDSRRQLMLEKDCNDNSLFLKQLFFECVLTAYNSKIRVQNKNRQMKVGRQKFQKRPSKSPGSQSELSASIPQKLFKNFSHKMSVQEKTMILIKFLTDSRVLRLLWEQMSQIQSMKQLFGNDIDLEKYRNDTLQSFKSKVEGVDKKRFDNFARKNRTSYLGGKKWHAGDSKINNSGLYSLRNK